MPRDFNPLVRRVAAARGRCDQIGAAIVEMQHELVGAEHEYRQACEALDRAIHEEGDRAALPATMEVQRAPKTMPERAMAVLERHPGDVLSTTAIAEEAGADEEMIYQALRRMVLKRREGVKQAGPGLWRYERPAGERHLRVAGEDE